MLSVLGNLLAEMDGRTAETAADSGNASVLVLCVVGLSIMALWQWRYGGFNALAEAPLRRHCVPLGLPFLLFAVWLTVMVMGIYGIDKYLFAENIAAQTFARNSLMLLLDGLMIVAMLRLADQHFARRLKGFGLAPKTLLRDLGWAAVNLTAVYPLIIGGILLVTAIGKMLEGDSFAIPTHQSLEELTSSEQPQLQVLLIILVVGVVPVMEEMLFRGLMQSALKALLPGVWPAVIVTSVLFAIVHYSTHAISIFALSCCIGYAYERSGSLFRSIFIHILFNGTSVAITLLA